MNVYRYPGHQPPRKPYRGNNTFHGKDGSILQFWRAGMDTVDIAKRLNVSQAFAANALGRILEDIHEAQSPGG